MILYKTLNCFQSESELNDIIHSLVWTKFPAYYYSLSLTPLFNSRLHCRCCREYKAGWLNMILVIKNLEWIQRGKYVYTYINLNEDVLCVLKDTQIIWNFRKRRRESRFLSIEKTFRRRWYLSSPLKDD